MIWAWLLGCPQETTEAPPTLAQVQAEVFDASCAFSTCHAAPGTNGLTLEEGQSHATLVDVESVDAPGEIRVIPGDPDNSYLVRKLEGGPDIVGDVMPIGAPLDQERIDLVRAWIAAGALDD